MLQWDEMDRAAETGLVFDNGVMQKLPLGPKPLQEVPRRSMRA